MIKQKQTVMRSKFIRNDMFAECIAGKYGLDCKEDCGNCFDNSQCFHVNGTCLSGCSASYQGHTCKGDLHD